MELCFECGKLVDEYYHKSKAICKKCYSQIYFHIKYPITILQYPYIIGNFLRTPPTYYNDKEINEYIYNNYTHNPYHCDNHISVDNRDIFFEDYDPICSLCFINKLRYH